MIYLILCKTLTQGQRAARALERGGITATLLRAPQGLSKNGCGYAVTVRRNLPQAIDILENARIPHGKLYRRLESGEYAEVVL